MQCVNVSNILLSLPSFPLPNSDQQFKILWDPIGKQHILVLNQGDNPVDADEGQFLRTRHERITYFQLQEPHIYRSTLEQRQLDLDNFRVGLAHLFFGPRGISSLRKNDKSW